MAVVEISRIQVRRGQENQTGVPTLVGGEFGWAADTEHLYIGLRRDDGGARDANVRILTENDLVNFFNVNQTLDSAYYTYRSDTATGFIDGITSPPGSHTPYQRLLRKKADDTVSIADFNVVGSGNETDKIQKAVDNLFLDPLKDTSNYGEHSAKILYFPAGTYNIDTSIFCPAYTTIIGEGIGKTIINLTSDAVHAFQTVGSDPATEGRTIFEDGISSGVTQPNFIHIEGITVQFDDALTNVANAYSLISIDCSENALIRRVEFKGNHLPTDGATTDYSGIDIRGNGGLTVSSENVVIDNCIFNGLYSGVKSNYDIINPIIQNSKFYTSVYGVMFNNIKDINATVGPRYARIINNRFEDIEEEGIYVGASDSILGTHHVSMNNQFYNVGNGGGDESTAITPVITFITDTNSSVNDYFDREEWQNQHTTVGTYYPLVAGKAVLDSSDPTAIDLDPSITTTLFKFPLTDSSQQLNIKYTVSCVGTQINRAGNLEIYIPADVVSSTQSYINDNYSYTSPSDGELAWSIILDSGSSFYSLNVTHTVLDVLNLEYQTKLMI